MAAIIFKSWGRITTVLSSLSTISVSELGGPLAIVLKDLVLFLLNVENVQLNISGFSG